MTRSWSTAYARPSRLRTSGVALSWDFALRFSEVRGNGKLTAGYSMWAGRFGIYMDPEDRSRKLMSTFAVKMQSGA
jgi:hypothetical protein